VNYARAIQYLNETLMEIFRSSSINRPHFLRVPIHFVSNVLINGVSLFVGNESESRCVAHVKTCMQTTRL
jgi:hypothetical protein